MIETFLILGGLLFMSSVTLFLLIDYETKRKRR